MERRGHSARDAREKRPPQWAAMGMGASASLLLHILFIGSAVMGSGAHARRSPPEGLGANAIASSDEAIATLILIEEPGAGPQEEDVLSQLASHGVVLQNFRLTIVSPDPTIAAALDTDEHPDESAAQAEPTAGDRQAQAALFGRYLAQIQARVERVWLRPRTPIGAESFDCRLQILQNEDGEVDEVTLVRCNGNTRWQLSVVQAAQSASPLPLPPHRSLFARSLQLSLSSRAWQDSHTDEGFEPPSTPIVARSRDVPAPPPDSPRNDTEAFP